MRRGFGLFVLVGAIVGCSETILVSPIASPTNLTYELQPSGDPEQPADLLLRWDGVPDEQLSVYRVYSTPDDREPFGLRGETTSLTFHDGGRPDLEYMVVAVDIDGVESLPSSSVVIDERLRLDQPDWIVSTSLNGAIYVGWADNPFEAAPDGFRQYRVYSSPYSLDFDECGVWSLEGTTVAPEFLSGALANGEPRCFGVSAESIEGWESLWSPIRADTPRPDARNVLVWAHEVNSSVSGFRFFDDLNQDGVRPEQPSKFVEPRPTEAPPTIVVAGRTVHIARRRDERHKQPRVALLSRRWDDRKPRRRFKIVPW